MGENRASDRQHQARLHELGHVSVLGREAEVPLRLLRRPAGAPRPDRRRSCPAMTRSAVEGRCSAEKWPGTGPWRGEHIHKPRTGMLEGSLDTGHTGRFLAPRPGHAGRKALEWSAWLPRVPPDQRRLSLQGAPMGGPGATAHPRLLHPRDSGQQPGEPLRASERIRCVVAAGGDGPGSPTSDNRRLTASSPRSSRRS